MWLRYQGLRGSGENGGQFSDCHMVSLKRDIFGEKINHCLYTSDVQTQDKLCSTVIIRECHSLFLIVDHVGEGNSARFSHDRVSECKE